MTDNLHHRPDLSLLKDQAKSLLQQVRAGDGEARELFSSHHPKALELDSTPRLADAQLVIARKTGFASWPKLSRHIEQLRDLEGTWEIVSLEVDGNVLAAPMFAGSKILMDGDLFRTEFHSANYEGEFLIDVETAPHHIDIRFVEGPEAGNIAQGIFEIDGDRLTICLGSRHGIPRPTQFESIPGTGIALETLIRNNKSRPKNVTGGTSPTTTQSPSSAERFCPELTDLHRQLEGEWTAKKLILDGMALPNMMLQGARRINEGTKTRVMMGEQCVLDVQLAFDASQSPIHVDLHQESTGSVLLGILEFDGKILRVCHSPNGQPRPAEFSSEKGSGRTFAEWIRPG